MPRYRKVRVKPKSVRRRRRKTSRVVAKVGKKLLRDARRRGTNSALEAAVKKISRKEAQKLMPPNLIFRNFILADYNMMTNSMTNFTQIAWDGLVISLGQIPITDNITMAQTAAPAQLPDPAMRPQFSPTVYGVNVIAPFFTGTDQFRSGLKVQIKNIALGLRASIALAPANPKFEHCFLKWAVVLSMDDAQSGQGWEPTPDRLLPMRKFGYSPRLDQGIAQQTSHLKTKTLMKGCIKLTYNDSHHVETQREKFRKTNFILEYSGNDLFGQQTIGQYKLFLVLRSNIPQADAAQYAPRVGGYYKLGYKNCT